MKKIILFRCKNTTVPCICIYYICVNACRVYKIGYACVYACMNYTVVTHTFIHTNIHANIHI